MVSNPAGPWMFVCCEYCVLSGRGICNELITRPEESYQLWCVVCDLETSSRMRRPWPPLGCSAMGGGRHLEVSATGKFLALRSPTECVCGSLSVIVCNNNPLHLRGVGRRRTTKKFNYNTEGKVLKRFLHYSRLI